MLEKPAIHDSQLMSCLNENYGLAVVQIDFLPIGADRNTAVFRAMADNKTSYFVKLRRGLFNEMSISIPKLLHEQGNQHIIAPLPTTTQHLWVSFGDFKVAVFPFVEGHDAYQIDLLDQHWIDFGHALKRMHSTEISETMAQRIQHESYTDQWRVMLRQFQHLVEDKLFVERSAAKLAEFLKEKKDEISSLVARADYLASLLQQQSEPFVLCHADIHAGNIFIDSNKHLAIVDWDTLILAPKERDLMFVGGGQFLNKRSAEEEERLFYLGYGQVETKPVALAYYRYERIVQDIVAYCEALLLTDEGDADRENGLQQLMGQFRAGNVIDMAYRSEKNLPEQYKANSEHQESTGGA